jgi:hypothetical protein
MIEIIEMRELLFHAFHTLSIDSVLPFEFLLLASISWNLAIYVDIDDSLEWTEYFESVEASVCSVERSPYCFRSNSDGVDGIFGLCLSFLVSESCDSSESDDGLLVDTIFSPTHPGVSDESARNSASAAD